VAFVQTFIARNLLLERVNQTIQYLRRSDQHRTSQEMTTYVQLSNSTEGNNRKDYWQKWKGVISLGDAGWGELVKQGISG